MVNEKSVTQKGGLVLNPDTAEVYPSPDFDAIRRAKEPPPQTLPDLKLKILMASALAFEKGNESGRIEEIAGAVDVHEELNPHYQPMPDVLLTQPIPAELKEWNALPREEKIDRLETRVRNALAVHPDLVAKRVNGLVNEVMSGVVQDESEEGIAVDEGLRPLLQQYLTETFIPKPSVG